MDRSRLLTLLTHYLAMFFAVWIALSVVWEHYGRQSIWLELLVLAVVCIAYVAFVRAIGIAPDAWEPAE